MIGQFRPICQRMANRILLDIIKKEAMQPGERLPTIASLVKRYGVSTATICASLAQLEQDGWIRVVAGSGSYVERTYLQHTSGRRQRLGLVLPSADKELALRTYQGVESVANQYGWELALTETHRSYEQEQAEVDRLFHSGCDAMVLSAVTRNYQQEANDYITHDFTDRAIVLVDCAVPEQKRPQVIFDNYALGFDMASMLIKNGRDRIAFMVTPEMENQYRNPVVIRRWAGITDAMRYAGLPESHFSICYLDYGTSSSERSTEGFINAWINRINRPNAVIALSDQPAMNLIAKAIRAGINVPDDLVVVGHDNLTTARQFTPAFCSSNPDFILMGATAARYAIERAAGISDQPTVIVLPVGIVNRGSILSVG